jgi:hypothetical protein
MAAVLAAVLGAGFAPAAQARWERPFQFAAPGSLDLLAPQLAFSPAGTTAAAFGTEDVDTPGTAQAYLAIRSAGGAVGTPRAVAGQRQILALAYDGSALELLTGSSPSDQVCCSSAQAIKVGAGGDAGRPRTLVGGLTGATLGQLLTLGDGRMLAAVATERGVWVAQSARGDRFGEQHRLTGASQMPESLAAAWLGGEATIVAWTAAPGPAGAADPRSLYYANGARTSSPRREHTALTVASGHRIDELGVGRSKGGETLAWIESWFDRRGVYHSQVKTMDIGAHAVVHTVSPSARLASGLTFDGDAAGDQAVSWASCTVESACTAQVATRGAGGQFGSARTLGAVDPSEAPALSVGPAGQVVVGWIRGGRPVAGVAAAPGRSFGTPTALSSTVFAHDITVGYGPKRRALAAWTQGTLNPSVVGAAYTTS